MVAFGIYRRGNDQLFPDSGISHILNRQFIVVLKGMERTHRMFSEEAIDACWTKIVGASFEHPLHSPHDGHHRIRIIGGYRPYPPARQHTATNYAIIRYHMKQSHS